jgi:hypothetical protein
LVCYFFDEIDCLLIISLVAMMAVLKRIVMDRRIVRFYPYFHTSS